MRSRGDLGPWLVLLAQVSFVACGGEGGRAADGGKTADVSQGACSGLQEPACLANVQCTWFAGCPTCDGSPRTPGCINASAGSACPAIACRATCDGLDEASCNADSSCAVQKCQGCGCTATFHACYEQGTTPTPCPQLGCPPPPDCGCRSQADCSGFQQCVPPGGSLGCGACVQPQHPCQMDSECTSFGPTYICNPGSGPNGCDCPIGSTGCVPGCTADADCGALAQCDLTTHRCGPKPCTADAECPQFYVCSPSLTPRRCVPKPCSSDANCNGGFCLNGSCNSQLGSCSSPPP